MKLLLIDDNKKFGELLKFKFDDNYIIFHAQTINQAISSSFVPDLILLDVNLGTDRAYNFVSLLSNKFNVPILAISSELERTTKYLMFENGVVDYIEKPIDFELLKMKLDNLNSINSQEITFNKLVLNTDSLMLNDQVKLSKNEFIILKYFMTNSQVIISKRELLRLLWENETYVEDTALNTLISRLRKKVVEVDPSVEIKSIRNQGIKFGVKC